jgi:hypothetical protein
MTVYRLLTLGASPDTAWQARPWSNALLRRPGLWTEGCEDALLSAADDGLRIEIGPDKDWAIAAIPDILIPPGTGRILVRVKALEGGGAWFMRLQGDLLGTGRSRTTGPFNGMSAIGEAVVDMDPRRLPLREGTPLQLQLGLEGKAGAYAVFESVEFSFGRAVRPPRGKKQPGQRDIDCVEYMPNIPQPFVMRDWRAVARACDRLLFDLNAAGEHLPLIWLNDSRINIDRPTFGLKTYVGDPRQSGDSHEGVACMGAVLGATVAGIDKRAQDHDYVLMCEAYHNTRNGQDLVLNYMDHETGQSFWYELWPQMVFYALASRYPGAGDMDAIVKSTADRWYEACLSMGGAGGQPDFNHTAFDFKTMKPIDNGKWREADSAAAIGWLEYMAWVRHGDPRHLEAAEWCMAFLDGLEHNPYYEALLPYGACLAARMNAERGTSCDVEKLVNWSFGVTERRGGWGVIIQNWNGYDCHGLVGSVADRGGYAFAMNTFAQAGALVPLVRYDARYARAIGKWMLNLANAARLFYSDGLPVDHQSSAHWKGDPDSVLAYEGLRREWDGKSPVAMGDAIALNWGPPTDLALYGSAYVGFLGGIVAPTNDPKILQLDCLATDFFHAEAYPTCLYFNPHDTKKNIEIDVGDRASHLYDLTGHRFVCKDATGRATFPLDGDSAAVIVVVPAEGEVSRDEGILRVDGVVVDYGVEPGD